MHTVTQKIGCSPVNNQKQPVFSAVCSFTDTFNTWFLYVERNVPICPPVVNRHTTPDKYKQACLKVSEDIPENITYNKYSAQVDVMHESKI